MQILNSSLFKLRPWENDSKLLLAGWDQDTLECAVVINHSTVPSQHPVISWQFPSFQDSKTAVRNLCC
ncbi:hypothetical protein GJ744_010485 [Endocarpon pusillum]|uniref:Uncharacterized protein n=1 Tax=Endocarpon pusillum TaxID=364733 RepID=A0A8H7AI05_9EURO|nr:hypothetical protein GJ744_010485 [Endocarpon pusillum]